MSIYGISLSDTIIIVTALQALSSARDYSVVVNDLLNEIFTSTTCDFYVE